MGEREREGKEVVLAERRPERIGTRASVDLKYIFIASQPSLPEPHSDPRSKRLVIHLH